MPGNGNFLGKAWRQGRAEFLKNWLLVSRAGAENREGARWREMGDDLRPGRVI